MPVISALAWRRHTLPDTDQRLGGQVDASTLLQVGAAPVICGSGVSGNTWGKPRWLAAPRVRMLVCMSDHAQSDDSPEPPLALPAGTADSPREAPRVTRRTTQRMVAGVASGLGDYFGVDPLIPRLLFVGLCFANGLGLFLYVLLWILVPSDDSA
ncbi:MAG: PspC domain-containing protein [Egibacteraceae bacterium]